jgi:hypothetical protein
MGNNDVEQSVMVELVGKWYVDGTTALPSDEYIANAAYTAALAGLYLRQQIKEAAKHEALQAASEPVDAARNAKRHH